MGKIDSNANDENPPTLEEERSFQEEAVNHNQEESAVDKKHPFLKKHLVKSVWLDALDLEECFKYFNPTNTKLPLEDTVNDKVSYPSELIVVLDLDNCLVHTLGDDLSITLLRPGVVDFLRTTMTRYETHIFTASMKDYADLILDALVNIVGVPFAGRWYRQHCTDLSHEKFVKDLESLGIGNLSKMVLVDDNALSFQPNPSNGIPIRDFAGDGSDKSLLSLTKLLSKLENWLQKEEEDVRTFLEKRFGVQAAYDKIHPHPCDKFSVMLLYWAMEKCEL